MSTEPELIYAQVSQKFIHKADRIFRNDDSGLFTELLQNARRAGATLVDVEIEELPGDAQTSRISVHDNGSGIRDFTKFLMLGESGWSEETRNDEDPAGMGLYSLCHSEVIVESGTHRARLTPEAFLGKEPMLLFSGETPVHGTRVEFTRPSRSRTLIVALETAAEFFPLAVLVNGSEISRHDFLAGALHREQIDGIEVGFALRFEHRDFWDGPNWNFHGLTLRRAYDSIDGLVVEGADAPKKWKLHLRFNVLKTQVVRLQLPERRALIEGEMLNAFLRKAKAAAYRFIQTLGRHVLSFQAWKEAKDLGVLLPEASPLLRTWHAAPADEYTEDFFRSSAKKVLSSTETAFLVSDEIAYPHTLEAAFQRAEVLYDRLYMEDHAFCGYSWYDALPRLEDATVFADGIPFHEWQRTQTGRPQTMMIQATTKCAQRSFLLRLPVDIHVESDDGLTFCAVDNSPWDNDGLDGSFDVVEFLLWASFEYGDDYGSDSRDTQLSEYREDVECRVNEYFRGPRAALLDLLGEAVSWQARQYVKELRVWEIRFLRKQEDACSWDIVLVTKDETHAQNGDDVSQP